MTRIAITGACGRMGRVIAGLVKDRADCTIIAGIDKLGVVALREDTPAVPEKKGKK